MAREWYEEADWQVFDFNGGTKITITNVWHDEAGDEHYDEIADIVMEYPDDSIRRHASLIAAAPKMLLALMARDRAIRAAVAASEGCPDGEQIPAHVQSNCHALFLRAERLASEAMAVAQKSPDDPAVAPDEPSTGVSI